MVTRECKVWGPQVNKVSPRPTAAAPHLLSPGPAGRRDSISLEPFRGFPLPCSTPPYFPPGREPDSPAFLKRKPMGMEIRRTIRYVHSSGDMAWGRGQGFVMRTQESRTPSPPPFEDSGICSLAPVVEDHGVLPSAPL